MSTGDAGFKAALEEARQGSSEGGVPIGAALVSAKGDVLGSGHNMRIQNTSATLHVCETAIRLNVSDLKRQRYPLWIMPVAFQLRRIVVQPCIPR